MQNPGCMPRTLISLAIALLCLALNAGNPARGAIAYWKNADGDWNDPNNWQPKAIPDGGSQVQLLFLGQPYTVSVNAPATAQTIQPGFEFVLAPVHEISFSVNSTLSVGTFNLFNSYDHGSISLNGTGTLAVAHDFQCFDQNMHFYQQGATNNIGGNLVINKNAIQPNSVYDLSGGTLNVAGSQLLTGDGIFNQTGGYDSFGTMVVRPQSSGLTNIIGGTFSGGSVTYDDSAAEGAGVFNVNGGSAKLSGALTLLGSAGIGNSSSASLQSGTLDVGDLLTGGQSEGLRWSGGNLFVNGNLQLGAPPAAPSPITPSVIVPDKSIFGGNGTIKSAVTVSSGGTLSPGDGGPGVLTFSPTPTTGGGTLAGGSQFVAQVNGSTAGSLSTNYSQLRYAPVGGALAPQLQLGGTLIFQLAYPAGVGEQYTLVADASGAAKITGTFAGLPEGAIFSEVFNGVSYQLEITYQGNGGDDVVVTVLPEPAMAIPLAVVVLFRRRPRGAGFRAAG